MSTLDKLENIQLPPSILSFAKDLPNLCSLTGLLCSLFALYLACLSLFPAAMIALIWAVVFDWVDGMIARKKKGRTKQQAEFGGQLDSLIDIISFAICPAVILLSYGDFNPWFFPGAFILVTACALRLSYFNVFGLDGNATYQGLACDNNVIILVFIFLFDGLLAPSQFVYLLYGSILALAYFNVAPYRTPKLSGGWFYILIGYAIFISLAYGWKMISIN